MFQIKSNERHDRRVAERIAWLKENKGEAEEEILTMEKAKHLVEELAKVSRDELDNLSMDDWMMYTGNGGYYGTTSEADGDNVDEYLGFLTERGQWRNGKGTKGRNRPIVQFWDNDGTIRVGKKSEYKAVGFEHFVFYQSVYRHNVCLVEEAFQRKYMNVERRMWRGIAKGPADDKLLDPKKTYLFKTFFTFNKNLEKLLSDQDMIWIQ